MIIVVIIIIKMVTYHNNIIYSLTLSLSCILAPALIRAKIVPMRPLEAANIRAVSPYYSK
jgi:hypothetical protein